MTTYEQSNSITEVSLKRFSKDYAGKFLASNDSAAQRQRNAQSLLDYLCDKFKMPHCTVQVHNRRQPHSTARDGRLASKKFGNYMVMAEHINIFNLTAVQGKPVAIKTMFDTLLHEFMHHYDMTKLKLGGTPHTKGFYSRISDLKAKLS